MSCLLTKNEIESLTFYIVASTSTGHIIQNVKADQLYSLIILTAVALVLIEPLSNQIDLESPCMYKS